MRWHEKVFRHFVLYAVTDLRTAADADLKKIEQAYRGGADIVQLRSKFLSDSTLVRIGLKMRKIANHYRKLFFFNDRVDLAIVTNADGVHLGQGDMPQSMARRLIRQSGKKIWIGRSTHTLAQALKAQEEGADYIGVGPIFKTPTKPQALAAGLKLARQVSTRIQIPWVAIGGIDRARLATVLDAGARRVAVVRAIFDAANITLATQQFKAMLKG